MSINSINSVAGKTFVFLCAFSVSLAVVFCTGVMSSFEVVKAPETFNSEVHQPPLSEDISDNNERSEPSQYKTVQSELVNFPGTGRVEVEAQEKIGDFPRIVFRRSTDKKLLLQSAVKDKEGFLRPEANSDLTQPVLRFKVIRSPEFSSPIVMAIGLFYGGSDNGYFLTLFTESNGRIIRLNGEPIENNVQGGYYLGNLNQRFGFGLAVWGFIWGNAPGEVHYSAHHYDIDLFKINKGKLVNVHSFTSRKMYDEDKAAASLGELGIKAHDQRMNIPLIRDSVE
jgi:hypothetical protein